MSIPLSRGEGHPLAQRRKVLDDVNTIAAYAKDMRDFLNESELTERRAFIKSFVKEIVVMPDDALLQIHRSHAGRQLDSRRKTAEKVVFNCSRSIYRMHDGGPGRYRTCDQSVMSRPLYH